MTTEPTHCEKCNQTLRNGWARSGGLYLCFSCGNHARLMGYQDDGILCTNVIMAAQSMLFRGVTDPVLCRITVEVMDRWYRIQEQNERFWRAYAETHAQHVERYFRGDTDPIDSPIGPITLSTGFMAGRRGLCIQAPAKKGSGWTMKYLEFLTEDRIDTHQGNFSGIACTFDDAMIMIETAISAITQGVVFKEEESA